MNEQSETPVNSPLLPVGIDVPRPKKPEPINSPFAASEVGPDSDRKKNVQNLLSLIAQFTFFNGNLFEVQANFPKTNSSGMQALRDDITQCASNEDLKEAMEILSEKGLSDDKSLINLGLLYQLQPNLNNDHVSDWLVNEDSLTAKKLQVFSVLVQDVFTNRFKSSALQDDFGEKNHPESDFFLPKLTHQFLKAVYKKTVSDDKTASYDNLIKFAKENPAVLSIVYALEKIYLTGLSADLARSPDKKNGLLVGISDYQTEAKIRKFIGQQPIPLKELSNLSIKDFAGIITSLTVENWLRDFSQDGEIERREKDDQWTFIVPDELRKIRENPVLFLRLFSGQKFSIPIGFFSSDPINPKINFSLVADHPSDSLGYIKTKLTNEEKN